MQLLTSSNFRVIAVNDDRSRAMIFEHPADMKAGEQLDFVNEYRNAIIKNIKENIEKEKPEEKKVEEKK